MTRAFLLGFILAIVILLLGGYLFVTMGMLPAGQDRSPGALETWAARASLKASIGRGARALQSPLQATEANLTAGMSLYVTNCQVCHGGADATESSIAHGLTPQAPQLAKEGVGDDPAGTTYWKIAHGIGFTGMPSFRQSLSENQMWQIALFVKQMDSLPPATRQSWIDAGRLKAPPPH